MTVPGDAAISAALGLLLLLACCLVLLQRREIARLHTDLAQLRSATRETERAEAATVAKARFLATVSHEIRTPLNGVLGLAQLLDMTGLDAEQASYVEAMREAGRALAQLIDDILDFSQIEAGRPRLRQETFALAPLVEGALELLAPRAMTKGLEIAGFISPRAPQELTGDPARLRQALVNLLGNAVNYTEKGGVGLRVHVAGDALRLDVLDSGAGVPLAAREAIFEAFERGDTEASRRAGGAGLGLSISRRLVELMGGRLTLSETSGAGSTFTISLPLASPPPAVAPDPLAGRRILLLSGSRFEAPLLAETLSAAGATVTVAGADRATACLSRGDASPADAAIIDCALGPEAMHRLAAEARAGGARQVFLLFSPLERRAFGEAALREVDGWLVKPVRKSSLLARLSQSRPGAPGVVAGPHFPLLEGLTLLLAEDNDVNALIISRALGKCGARAVRARDGAEAAAIFTQKLGPSSAPFDAILMDLFLPGLDGREATARIRDAESRAGAPRTPIVVVTASVLEQDARAARAAGADALLTKPVDLTSLAATLDELRVSASGAPRGASGGSGTGAGK